MIRGKIKLHFAFSLVIVMACLFMYYLPTGFENEELAQSTLREKAEVISVDNSDLQKMGLVTVGTQTLQLQIKSGKFKGDTSSAVNILMGQMTFDKIFIEGDQVLAILKLNEAGTVIVEARADDIYRIHIEWVLFILFAVFLILFARWTGFKALLSFVFTAMAMWKVLIPLLLKGYSPLIVAFCIVILSTSVIILLISGFTRKGLVALSGSIAGIAVTTILALFFGYFFRIPGTVQDFSEMLLYAGFAHLNLSEIFTAGIFLSAAGAVMDVAMDIAAAQDEIVKKLPAISSKELIKSGFRIAYPVIGTMTTTLLFAYSGSFMFVFMMFMAKGTPMVNVFNVNYIAAEVLHTMVGSFGLVLVAPLTAIIGGFLFQYKK
ncbi:YibE/F family protein [Marinilabiliaceae bacterium JC017]|nr:YibE/F family protein [Marinilabiliaceae bacterium JC017]